MTLLWYPFVSRRFLTLDHLELFADSQKIFGMSMAGSLDEAGHSAMRMHLTDGNDEQVLSTDNQMTWAKPEEGSHSWGPAGHYNDSEVHLSLHSKTDLFSLLEWNTSVSVDFAENIYAVRVIDVDTAGKPTFRVDGDGYFLKDKGSM